jgi:5'-nucleotidase / UDP-sugar diphosphatase
MLTVLPSLRSVLATASLAGCLLVRVAADVPPPASVTILHFNDVYEIDAVEGGRSGGLARVAKVDGEPLAGRHMVSMLNAVGLDWATFGNHEFDVAEAAFHKRLAESRFKYVSSNVVDATGKPFDGTPQSAVVTVRSNGRPIRLGLVGLTIDSNRKPWVQYLPPIDSARAQVAALRGKADAIVALTHLALATDQALVEAVPEIDVALGGHEHENWMIRRGPAFTPIIKADANVRSVAIVSLNFGKPGVRPTVSARFEVLDTRVPQDKRVEAEAQKWIALAFNAFKSQGFVPEAPLVTIPEPLDGRESSIRNHSNELTGIIVASLVREVKQADVGLLNAGSIRIDDQLPSGPIRVYDVIRLLPFGGKVLKATFDGALLTSVLDIGESNQGTGGYLHRSSSVTRQSGAWLVNGKPIQPDARYTVALPEFLLTGGEANLRFLTRTNPQVHDVQEFRDIRFGLFDELRARYGPPKSPAPAESFHTKGTKDTRLLLGNPRAR